MATVDEFVVKLLLDNKKFKEESKSTKQELAAMKKEANATAAEMKAAGAKAGEFFKQVTGAALAFFAVLAGGRGLVDFTRETINTNAALAQLGKNLGESSRDLFAWKRAVSNSSGGDGAGFLGTIEGLSSAITQFKVTGDSGPLKYFQAMGIAIANLDGSARKPTEILLDLAKAVDRKQISKTDAFNLAKAAGVDRDTANLIMQGGDALEQLLAVQATKAAADEAWHKKTLALRNAWSELKNKTDDMMQSLLQKALPVLEKLVKWLDILLKWCEENPEVVIAAFAGLVAIIATLGIGLLALAAPLIAISAPFVVLALKIGAVVAALTLLYQWFAKLVESEAFKKFTTSSWFKSFSAGIDASEGGDGNAIGSPAKSSSTKSSSGAPRAMQSKPASSSAGGSAIDYFMSQGWTRAQAAGIVANLHAESKMNPSIPGDGGKAYGIAQWHPDRQKNFEKWAGKSIRGSSREEQMAFVHYELTQGTEKSAGNRLRGATTAAQAGSIVSEYYERPADRVGESRKRAALANQFAGADSTARAGAADRAASRAPTAAATGDTQITVGQVVIQTPSQDPQTHGQIARNAIVSQADTGMS